jgi:hypothetical protein
MSFHNRSDALIELLEELTQEGHESVLVFICGGRRFTRLYPTFGAVIVVAVADGGHLLESVFRTKRKQIIPTAKHPITHDRTALPYECVISPQE